MEKFRKTLTTKVVAVLLAVALVIGAIPMSMLNAQAVNYNYGTVETISEVGGTVDSSDKANIQVVYDAKIKYLEADDTVGRATAGWYIGAVMTAPSSISDFNNALYTNADGTEVYFGDVTSVDPIYMWKQIDKTEFDNAKANSTDLVYTWVFDWDKTDSEVQNVVFTVAVATANLSDEDTVAPVVNTAVANPSTWTKNEVVITGSVSDNFSGVKSVFYKKAGTNEENAAVLTGNSYSFTVDATTYKGDYVVWCVDNKDNKSEDKIVSVLMDTTAPTISAQASTTNWTKSHVVISGVVADEHSGVSALYCAKENESGTAATYNATTGEYSITIEAQEYNGKYIVTVVDAAGNEAYKEVSVKMDNKIPEMTNVKADLTDWTNTGVVISGNVSDELSGISKVYYKKGVSGTPVEATNNAGAFSINIDPQEYEGSYYLYCVDNAGNSSSENVVSVKMDNGKCRVVTASADKSDWTNEKVTINGTVEDDLSGVKTVTWIKEGDQTQTGTATYDADKNEYSFEVPAQNYKGKYIITCQDKAENTSDEVAVEVYMDITAPVVDEVNASKTVWTNSSVTISGTVSDALSGVSKVIVNKEGELTTQEATLVGNTYSLEISAQDYKGNYVVKCVDKAGNVSEAKTVAVQMDATVPTITAQADKSDWTNGQVVISGDISDNLSGVVSVTYRNTNGKTDTVTITSGQTQYTITLEPDDYSGIYTIYATDAAGNKSIETTVTVKMDKTAPTVESAVADKVDWTNGQVVISGKVKDNLSGVASVTYKKTGASGESKVIVDMDGSYKITLVADDYEGTYTIYCTDNAGTDSQTSTVAVKMDKTIPVVESASANITDWTNGQVVISGSVSDNLSQVASVTYKKSGTIDEKAATFDASQNKYTIVLAADDYEGTYTIYCTDKANNVSVEKTVAVKMDKTAPTMSEVKADITDWTNGNVVISGKLADNLSGVEKVTVVKVADNTAKDAVMNGDTFTFEIEAQNYDGDYTITCVDRAGNVSVEATVSVKMDNTKCVVATGVAESSSWTNKKVVISGTVSDNLSGVETVTWVKEGDTTQKGNANFSANDNTYSFDVAAQDYEGNYIITCTDKAGNVSTKFTVKVYMDITKPVVETAVSNITVWTPNDIVISGTVSDNLAGVETVTWIKEGDSSTGTAEFDATNKTFKFNVAKQDYEGDYIITCADKAGNVSQPVRVSVQMDITNPVVDTAVSNITVWTPNDIIISGTVSDNLAGVKTVTWVKEGDTTQKGNAEFDAAKNTFKFDVPKQNYKGDYIITCTDKAGNVSAEVRVSVKMDITIPVVETLVASTTDWTNQAVTISGTVSDNLAGVETVTWVKEGDGSTGTATFDANKNTFTFTIEAQSYQGNYVITCTDKAGNVSAEKKVGVKMDNVIPSNLELQCGISVWNEIIQKVTFGLFYNNDQTMVVRADDNLSGIHTILYYEKEVKEGDTDITREYLDTVKDWKEFATIQEENELSIDENKLIEKSPNRNIVYCVKVIDYTGNYDYVTSDGMIFDTMMPEGGLTDVEAGANKMIAPVELPVVSGSENQAVQYVPGTTTILYGKEAVGQDGVVEFKVNITETSIKTILQQAEGTTPEVVKEVLQSGIKKVTYKVEASDDGITYQLTQGANHDEATGEAVLCSTPGELNTKYEGIVQVNAEKNNYNYIKITVEVSDNAGNTISDSYEFAIDITEPKVQIAYDDDESALVYADNNQGYYGTTRKAFITYTERSENWIRPEISKLVKAKNLVEELQFVQDEEDETIYYLNNQKVIVEWADVEDTMSSDADVHIATVTFEAEAQYDIDLDYTDAAGNSIERDSEDNLIVDITMNTIHPFKFTVDKTAPTIDKVLIHAENVNAEEGVNYYGENAKISVEVTDLTSGVKGFAYKGTLNEGVSAINKEVVEQSYDITDEKKAPEEYEILIEAVEGDKFLVTFYIPREQLTEQNSFNGVLAAITYDMAHNQCEEKAFEDIVVVDKIAPTVQVTFEQPINEENGVSYYDKDFVATIVINEANFFANDVVIMTDENTRVYPTDWTQTPGTDVWTAHVSFTAEADYVLTVDYTDRSGNVMEQYKSNQKTLDKTSPVISVTGVKHQSANNAETIGFVMTVTDKNLMQKDIAPRLTASIREGDNSSNYTFKTINISLGTPSVSTNAQGETVYTYKINNLDTDGYYSLTCTVTDLAKHVVRDINSVGKSGANTRDDSVNYSVNRNGSVFWIETTYTDKDGKKQDVDLNNAFVNGNVVIKLHEINVDKVNELSGDNRRTVLTLNDGSSSRTIELEEILNGKGNYEKNVIRGEGGWYQTIYTLNTDQFAKDGTYSLNIITYDEAENSNVNTKSEEGTITFIIDRTKPVITSNVKSKDIIDQDKFTVEFKIAEVNLDESTIIVKVKGKEHKFEKVSGNTFQFEVEDMFEDTFTIEVMDKAGNSADTYEITDFTVSTNWLVLWYANKPLFWGTIGGVIGVVGIALFAIIWKRRKNNIEA